ncbi:MAG: InlB B-repeat-containing protein, partial [Acholeplasmataceae bacterium]|nr:InlB B-repeat-containing protein [Acholeplasmataceae bacterium]
PTGTIPIESKDIHGNLTGVQSHARTQDLEVMDVPTNDTWWDLNVPSISSSLLWTVDDNGFAYLTLIGSFKKEVAVVTFDVDGGSVVLAQMILIGTNKALEPTAPEKFGFDFVGWSSVPESYVAFDFDEFIVEDTILYAIWLELNVFTVTFEVEGESDVDVLVVEGDTVGMPDDPIKEGKNFEGWFKDGDLDPFDFETLITEDITLIAAFVDKVFYDVTFLDGISDTEDATLLYHFDFTSGHGTSYTTTPETPVNFTNLVDVQPFGVSLYRVAANTASVVGSSRALVISPRLGTGYTGYAYVELDFGVSIINKLEFDTFFWSLTAEQYFTSIELLVWDDVEETWVLVLDLLDVLEGTLNIHSLSVDGFEGSMFRFYTTGGRDGGNDARVLLDNLKASEVEYLDEVDVVVEEGYLVSEPADPVKEGFIFLGWFVDIEDEDPFDFVTPITGNLTLTALFMIIEVEYTVSFVADGGTPEPEDQEVVDGLLATEPDGMTKDGYTFAGWFVDDGFTTEWDFDVDVVTDDMVLYAKWDEEVPSGTAITTTQEFYDATRNGTVGVEYYLANDLDFDGYVWNTVQATSFRGSFNGNGKTITNLSIGTGTETDRGGIFPTINGATIFNLTITNSSVDVNARAGLIAGRVENNASSIENITIINSSVSGNGGEAVGIVVGQVSITTTIQNIYISLSSSSNTLGKYTGLILGRADHA